MYDEVTASNLVKIDLDGNKVESSEWDINPAGFIIHSAVHSSKYRSLRYAYSYKRGYGNGCFEKRLNKYRF